MTRSGRHNEDIAPLYEIEDETGVLDKHRNKMLGPFMEHQVDMKIMYYELIKMLISHDTPPQSGGGQASQEMTARLQRYLNQRFLKDLETIKRQSNTNNKPVATEQQDVKSLMARLSQLEENQGKLERSNKELKETNRIMMAKFSSLARPAFQSDHQVGGERILSF